jgi:predicted negative regulator of RcsB-dependent stress response
MATHLDLEEQEQIDRLKAFWKQYGNAITWLLIVVLGGFAAWNGWNWYQRDQGAKAGALYDEIEQAVGGGKLDAASGMLKTMQDRYGSSAWAQQGALLVAKAQWDSKQPDAAIASLQWVATRGAEAEMQTVARLRLAGILIEQKKYDEALRELDAATAKNFEGLVADRRGDVLLAQGKTDDAKAAYQKAHGALSDRAEYRRIVEAKLVALGAPPPRDPPKTIGVGS